MTRWTMLVLAAGLCGRAAAAELDVGPGKPYDRIEAALAAARPGDTIRVHPRADHAPYERVALYVDRPRIAIRAAADAGRPVVLSGRGFDYSGRGRVPRAIVQFAPGADDGLLEGFELTGAHNESHNGAGVRINQANRVTVRACIIHGNDMGIMSNGDGTPRTGADQLIEACRIHANGDRSHPGYNHNLYLGGTSVTVRGCEIHGALTGHNVKSRARLTRVLACYVHDSANREFDLVDARGDTTEPGSDAVLAGNVIVKNPKCAGNRGVIHFGQDGGQEHDGTLWLVHNTIVTPFISPVVSLSAPRARVRLFNNLVWDGGAPQGGQKLVERGRAGEGAEVVGGAGLWLSSGFGGAERVPRGVADLFVAVRGAVPPFVKPGGGDYRLAGADAHIVNRGVGLPAEARERLGGPVPHYRPPQGWEVRPAAERPDLGAYEWVPPPE